MVVDMLDWGEKMDQLRLRRVAENDCGLLFAWVNDRETRNKSFCIENIAYEEHVEWFQRKMREASCQMFILMRDEKEAGQIRIDWQGNAGEISYSIAPEYRGMGLGSEILRLAEPYAGGKILWGRVRGDNAASAKCFEKNGYVKVERELWIEYSKKIDIL